MTEAGTRPRLKTLARPWALIAAGGSACFLVGLSFLLFASVPGPAPAEARSLGRGIIDYRIEQPSKYLDMNSVPAIVTEMGPKKLRAKWTRLLVHWKDLQPQKPGVKYAGDKNGDGYDDAYLAKLRGIAGQLHAVGIKIVMTPLDVPGWANGGRKPYYAPKMNDPMVSREFYDLGKFLASRFKNEVKYFECWNEPNQGTYLYPQTPISSTNGGAATYLKMLKKWYPGVKAGSRDAVVIGGATAPRGRGDAGSTPPQAFARYLKANGAASYMNAYSHHPYTPGGSTRIAPGQKPNNATRCVTLGNLNQLTKLFPRMPFYLTEYGYNTQYCRWFGVTVSRATQARYMRQAFSYTARRYPQVRTLMWFLVDDWNPAGKPTDKAGMGVYMGVRTYKGQPKPGWYAFAGGNSLTLKMPASAKRRKAMRVSGKLTHRAAVAPRSEALTLQARRPGTRKWKKVVTIRARKNGTYSRFIKQSSTRIYRIVWGGVVESKARKVRAR
jgi:hypothetical protein